MSKKSPELSFEDSIQRLNDIVENLEKGNSSLEETILIFEEGMKLTEQCRKKINEVEEKVSTLIKTSEGFQEKPGV
ncbi:MAG: exodeoxyribonuclease VII small subunit [Candidatus Marinimicrobia bacterium]|jgi:exodeoxyribonuclease VII small subunit|nr:exodeoxyribonuclease VII small subunit [Candidatus Neomarinimicrobiota bacterium]MBT4731630.1 exodeoxyribonuclease VII small subunit [Candidatus Woesearchaeota archaeon]MBT5529094.1 exodeoxyribonuclease VII small subunit [Cytophagia bacterium]MBT3634315.1 exodeoxyribonuclease VII small subunit [Candidatus Neomarinimicrobiota bacterium]MBT3681776.1 exodeoxyribonuclease VII small subunit [Candidatus Neomarinimicrobiota bacterium]